MKEADKERVSQLKSSHDIGEATLALRDTGLSASPKISRKLPIHINNSSQSLVYKQSILKAKLRKEKKSTYSLKTKHPLVCLEDTEDLLHI